SRRRPRGRPRARSRSCPDASGAGSLPPSCRLPSVCAAETDVERQLGDRWTRPRRRRRGLPSNHGGTAIGGARMSAITVTIAPRMPQSDPTARGVLGDPLVDTHGRVHRDLRVSLTDRCSLRCTYCMPEQGNEWLAKTSILTLDEIERVARVAAASGISTFRLTGGEPLLRPDIVDIVR